MEATPKDIRIYVSAEGKQPFREWYKRLTPELRLAVDTRLRHVQVGSLGDVKPEGEGVSELRFHAGKGIRIYFGQEGNRLVILLAGGDKSTQERDLQHAKAFWKDYKQRARSGSGNGAQRPETGEWSLSTK